LDVANGHGVNGKSYSELRKKSKGKALASFCDTLASSSANEEF
jgi:hypothetical protein